MSLIGVKDAYLNAVVPTLGFNLSTWSVSFVKGLWESSRNNKEEQNNNLGSTIGSDQSYQDLA